MAFDVDGVLTDGTLYYTVQGEEIKAFHVRDGHGLKMLAGAGILVAIITGRSSQALRRRADELGISLLVQGADDKRGAMQHLLRQQGLSFAQAGYMGDDIVDLPLLLACGFAASVRDGHAEVRNRVHYVTRTAAGHGAAREVCELILAAQGKLAPAIAAQLNPGA